MPLSCIVFDCDGIILETVDVKNQAFARVCDAYFPSHTPEFIDFVNLHGGVSRYEKFSWLVERAMGRLITTQESNDMGKRFTRYCMEAVYAAPLVPGFLETADQWLGKVPMYVASGTPHHELGEIIEHHRLTRYFTAVLGTPPAKAALLHSCVHDAGALPDQTVMVGDSKTDFDAAVIVGTRFYGRGDYFTDKNCPHGPDLFGLNAFLMAMRD